MHEALQENIEMVKLGRELLEGFIADELSGKEQTGHFVKEGAGGKREPDENFILDELEPEDFIIVNKILVGIIPDDYWSYAEKCKKSGNKSRQALLAMLNNKIHMLNEKRGALPQKRE